MFQFLALTQLHMMSRYSPSSVCLLLAPWFRNRAANKSHCKCPSPPASSHKRLSCHHGTCAIMASCKLMQNRTFKKTTCAIALPLRACRRLTNVFPNFKRCAGKTTRGTTNGTSHPKIMGASAFATKSRCASRDVPRVSRCEVAALGRLLCRRFPCRSQIISTIQRKGVSPNTNRPNPTTPWATRHCIGRKPCLSLHAISVH